MLTGVAQPLIHYVSTLIESTVLSNRPCASRKPARPVVGLPLFPYKRRWPADVDEKKKKN
jgi:hypothetical protein